MPFLPRSERMREKASTFMEAPPTVTPGMSPRALRIRVMWGEKRFRSKGIPFSARARRILRARASRGGDAPIPAHQRSPKQPKPSRHREKGVKDSVDEIREEKGKSVDAYFREVFKC